MVGIYPGSDYDIAERNKELVTFCNAAVHGIGSLSAGDVNLSLSELSNNATSDALKAFSLDFTNYGAGLKDNFRLCLGSVLV